MNRRAFTILETMLAVITATIILLAAYGLLSAVRASDKRSQQRAIDAQQLALIHQTFSRAFATIVTEERTGGLRPPSADRPIAEVGDTPTIDQRLRESKAPRLILDTDPLTGRQRLEVVLAEPPIRGLRMADPRAPEPTGTVRTALRLAPAYRGEGFDLVLDTLAPLPERASPSTPRDISGSRLIAANISDMRTRFWRGDPNTQVLAPSFSASALLDSDLPAYAEVEVQLASGRKANWMFEIAWGAGVEPILVDPTLAQSRGSNPDDPNSPDGLENSGRPPSQTAGGPVGNGAGPRPAYDVGGDRYEYPGARSGQPLDPRLFPGETRRNPR
jgi:hypothetical protein